MGLCDRFPSHSIFLLREVASKGDEREGERERERACAHMHMSLKQAPHSAQSMTTKLDAGLNPGIVTRESDTQLTKPPRRRFHSVSLKFIHVVAYVITSLLTELILKEKSTRKKEKYAI